jgi:CheY-like chemotaxis protein
MDHMMPVMDGIEATKIIRHFGYEAPIVALTANAIAGQADMFLKNGFDSFVSKPIDVHSLNDVLIKYVRDTQSKETLEEFSNQIDNESYDYASDDEQSYINHKLAEIFVRDALKSIDVIERLIQKDIELIQEDIDEYVIHTHGLKSALANVGYFDLSQTAGKLEKCGNSGNIDDILSHTPAFLVDLKNIVDSLVELDKPRIQNEDGNYEVLHNLLMDVKAACEVYDEKAADYIITKLQENSWNDDITALLDKISYSLLHSEFDEIVNSINEMIE